MSRALLLIDPQTDFISGSLPVPGAEEAMSRLADFLLDNPSRYALKIITLDWHPWNHSSFADNGGQWPAHCVAFSQGAAVWPRLYTALHTDGTDPVCLTKGVTPEKEEYSIFQNPDSARRFISLIKKFRIKDIDICGLAGDFCVLNSLKDGVNLGLPAKFNLLKQFSPSLDGGKNLKDFAESL